jgi:hypothetical protein
MDNETGPENSRVTDPTSLDRSAPTQPKTTLVPDTSGNKVTATAPSPAFPAPAPKAALPSDPVDLIRQLIPTSLRKRRFRTDSFVAKLSGQQLATVIAWLQEHAVDTVRAKVAAAPPEGFGLQACSSALYRLRNLVSNTELNHWIENAMDATYDIIDADTSVNTAPMREALSLLLHSRIMTYTREQANPISIDRLLSALTRLEKLKTHISQRSHLASAPREKSVRHQIDVHITTNPASTTATPREAITLTGPPVLGDDKAPA